MIVAKREGGLMRKKAKTESPLELTARRPPLSERHRRFIEAFMGRAKGNATEAAIIAGYSKHTARKQGSRLLTKGDIKRAIEERVKDDPAVADREEIQRTLTLVVRANGEFSGAELQHRLRAMELLGKSQKMFGASVDVHHFDHEGHLAAIEERRLAGLPLSEGQRKLSKGSSGSIDDARRKRRHAL